VKIELLYIADCPNGVDVGPHVNLFPSYGVSCRAYFVDGGLEGVPPREWILNAVLSSKSSQCR
jgi:hypothetical protein